MEGVVQFGDQMLLSTGDFRQGRRRFHQCQNRPALGGGDGGQVDGRGGLHELELPQNPSKNTQNQPVGSL